MTLALVIAVVVIALLLSGFFSGAETGFYCVNPLRVQVAAQRGQTAYRRIARLLHDRQRTLYTMLIGNNVSNYVLTAAATYLFTRQMGLSDRETEFYTVAVLTPVVFVFGEMIPKNLFQSRADALMPVSGALIWWIHALLHALGVLWLFEQFSRLLYRLLPGDVRLETTLDAKRRVALMLREALVDEETDDEQLALVDRVVHVSETQLHAVMIPRNRVQMISADAGYRDIVNLARRGAPAYLPVFDKTPRRILGIIKIDALLYQERLDTVREELRHVPFFRPHDSVAHALAALQHAHVPMGIVTDRGGMLLGIVTLKDMIEQIVGELPDAPHTRPLSLTSPVG